MSRPPKFNEEHTRRNVVRASPMSGALAHGDVIDFKEYGGFDPMNNGLAAYNQTPNPLAMATHYPGMADATLIPQTTNMNTPISLAMAHGGVNYPGTTPELTQHLMMQNALQQNALQQTSLHPLSLQQQSSYPPVGMGGFPVHPMHTGMGDAYGNLSSMHANGSPYLLHAGMTPLNSEPGYLHDQSLNRAVKPSQNQRVLAVQKAINDYMSRNDV